MLLPASSRMRAAADFESAMRRGFRGGRSTVVLHLVHTADERRVVGFTVSRAVGNAVVRNKVKRRLRAIMAGHLSQLPTGTAVVVRALPAAANAPYSRLHTDVTSALSSVRSKADA